MEKTIFRIAPIICLCAIIGCSAQLQATVIQHIEGLSENGDSLIFESKLTITGNTLTVELLNRSSLASNSPDDLLSSYFFDIYNSLGQRPELVLLTATGDVYKTSKDAADMLQTANANLKAVNKGDYTWQFKALNAAATPCLGFGLGTVGNSDMSPNNFNGNIVDGLDYSIYVGEVTTQSVSNTLLVKNSITFVFSGVAGFAESDISDAYLFGAGTKPDKLFTHTIPEPATLVILCLGCLLFRKKNRKSAKI